MSCCAYSAAVQFYDPPELSKDFTNAIDELPENYDKEQYMEFIESFGTHYIKQADMGALYGQQSQVSSKSWGRMTDEEISISASAGYSGIFETADFLSYCDLRISLRYITCQKLLILKIHLTMVTEGTMQLRRLS